MSYGNILRELNKIEAEIVNISTRIFIAVLCNFNKAPINNQLQKNLGVIAWLLYKQNDLKSVVR